MYAKFDDILDVMKARGYDPTGHGHYGAKRGDRLHRGFDIRSVPGENVYAPFAGLISKVGYVYKGDLSMRYVEISNKVYRVRLMYVSPDVHEGQRVAACEIIGRVQDVSGYWGRKKASMVHRVRSILSSRYRLRTKAIMINHVHVEVYKHTLLTDPEPLLRLG